MKSHFKISKDKLRYLSALMIFFLVLVPVQAHAGNLHTLSGSVDWNFNVGTGNLTITGSGKVAPLPSIMPWDSNKAAITSIHMDSTVQPTNMARWFSYCSSLTSTNAVDWDVSQVTDMMGMFAYCWTLTIIDVSNWNTAAVTDMSAMFVTCKAMTDLDVSNWNTAAVTNMESIFGYCWVLNSLVDVSNWNTSAVTNMKNMFNEYTSLKQITIGPNWQF